MKTMRCIHDVWGHIVIKVGTCLCVWHCVARANVFNSAYCESVPLSNMQ